MSEPDQPNFRVLKIVVVVLGIAILVMTAIIIYTAIDRFGGQAVEDAVEAGPSPAPETVAVPAEGTPWSRDLGDARIVDAQMSGGLLMLRTETPAGRVAVEVVDPATGRAIGRATGR